MDANQLNVLSEFVGGYLFNGKPLANMVFKIMSTDVVGQVRDNLTKNIIVDRLTSGAGSLFRARHEAGPLLENS